MTVKRFFKLVGISIGSFVLLIVVYLLAAYVLSRISVTGDEAKTKDVTIYILTNGVHTDLVVPVQTEVINWNQFVDVNHTKGKDTTATYVAFGWGDKGFYLETPTWADLKVSTAFRAAFSLSTSAIHATFYKRLKENDSCKKILMSREQYEMLVQYIQGSFQLTADGKAIHIETTANYDTDDAFYEATGSYNLFHTCNTWANNGLKACGQKACLWTPFDTGIFYHYANSTDRNE